jgi:hypothetical protein
MVASKDKKEIFERLSKLTKQEKKPMNEYERQAGLLHRLDRMEALEREGSKSQSQQAKKDLWAKLADQAKKKDKKL